jgi:hypothetical protein
MSYFKNFPLVNYKFGDLPFRTYVQDMSVYVDLIDQIDDSVSFYEYYNILDGDRPDTLSYKIYGTVDYYWTFYLLNPQLRQSGWPLGNQQLETYAQNLYKGGGFYPSYSDFSEKLTTGTLWNYTVDGVPKIYSSVNIKTQTRVDSTITVITMDDDGFEYPHGYVVGDLVRLSGGTGTGFVNWGRITTVENLNTFTYEQPQYAVYGNGVSNGGTADLHYTLTAYRQWDLGYVVLKDTKLSGKEFHALVPDISDIRLNDPTQYTITLTTPMAIEPELINHYKSNGEHVDMTYAITEDAIGNTTDIVYTAPAFGSAVSNMDKLTLTNDDARKIKIFKNSSIANVVSEFQRLTQDL